ncbi:MAG: HlyD family efflux transporter periplasmic adaptor subunit [Flammeovirgaceae bacterium]|nr:MAG: HlyD family efflux transporter periplasmic adaptor subunit [Flammeovirgaceae bacterium]
MIPRLLTTAFIIVFILNGCGKKEKFTKPQIKPLVEAVYASGNIVSENEYQAFAQVDGYVADKHVQDGDPVRKGDALYTIQADQQTARYRIARENYELALKNFSENSPVLAELKAALTTARTKMLFDSTNFIRYSNLLKNNATSRAEYDRMKLVYENSKNDFLLAESRYKRTYDQLQLDLRNAENQFRIARDESDRYTIRSQVDGLVFKTLKEKGELIKRNEVVAVLGSANSFYLQLNVDELDIQRIQVGQPVVVKIDAYPDRIFNAVVSKIYPLVDVRQQAFRVDATLTEKLPGTFSGLALEANIIIRQNPTALVIPKNALLPGDSVIIRSESGYRKTKISRGITTLDEVEILSGIDSQTQVKIN